MNLGFKLYLDLYAGGLLHILLKAPTVLLGKILRRNHDLGACSSVTFVKMLGGGSLVIAYPALLAIKGAPKIRALRILTTPSIKAFAETLGIFDEILVIRDDSLFHLALDSLRTLWKLFRCEVMVDLEIHSRLTTVFTLLTCARNRVGFYTNVSFWRKNLSTHLLFCNVSNGIYNFYDQIAHLFGGVVPALAECTSVFRSRLSLPLGGEAQDRPYRIGLAPCCSDLSKERMLSKSEWIRVLKDRLGRCPRSREVELHLLGAKADVAVTEELSAAIGAEFPEVSVSNHAGKLALADSVRHLARMDEQICIDSALLHFGRLAGIPATSYWGPTDPRILLRPSAANRDDIHYEKLSCSPCVHLAQRAPCEGNNLCMRFAADPDYPGGRNPVWLAR